MAGCQYADVMVKMYVAGREDATVEGKVCVESSEVWW